MKLNIDYVFTDENEVPIPDYNLGKAITQALLATYSYEKDITGEEKYKRYELVQKVKSNGDFSIEEIAKLKKLIGMAFTPLIVGQAWDALENIGSRGRSEPA